MFTDIVGYTALMGRDEEKAFEWLQINRDIQRPVIELHNGRWIKELGDGVLASFHSVSDALNAAIKIQQKCNTSNDFQLRIGIHLGEVLFENDDVFGDGVNIASRLQALAPPGGIWISESVHNNVSNKKGFDTEFITSASLKNVKDAIRVYQVKAEGVISQVGEKISAEKKLSPPKNATYKKALLITALVIVIVTAGYFIYSSIDKNKKGGKPAAIGEMARSSIAVLPFVNMSNDKEQEYFSDGMSEELLNLLSKVPDLKVISRTSSFSFKGKNQDVRTIGGALGVANILEGSVRRSGNTIRITAQLIETKNGTHLWSETFDRQMNDVFAVQDEISKMIVNILKIKLLDKHITRITKRNTENPDAFEDYLKGRYNWNQRTDDGLRKAVGYFESAIKKDPNYAAAYSGLSDVYLTMFDYDILSFEESTRKAKQAAQRALEIDKDLAEANNSLAHIYLHDWHWREAEEGFKRALELDPGYVLAYHWYALCLTALGRSDEAVEQMKIARELDPLSVRISADLGMALLAAGKYDDAIRQEEKTMELDSNARSPYWIRGMAYQQKKMSDEAIKDYREAVKRAPGNSNFLAALGNIYASTGNTAEARKILDTLMVQNKEYPVSFFIALVYAGLNDKQNAIKWIEKACDERSGSVRYLKMEPRLSNLRDDPRYAILMRKVGLEK
jgi:TolB-like protein/tetratricopeptide (TPR) repeat protein